ncbi:MAG: HAD family hydrolase [Syntrophobacteraceae bacterium]
MISDKRSLTRQTGSGRPKKKRKARFFLSSEGIPGIHSYLSTAAFENPFTGDRIFRARPCGKVCAQCGVKPDDEFLRKSERRYWDIVEGNTRLFPEALDTLDKLSRKYRLGLITNTQGQGNMAGHRLGRFPELERLFEKIVIAGEAGIPPKPDPAPFWLCLDALGLLPGEAVFVGDDLRIDIRGADSAGLYPIWIKHYLVKRSWPNVKVLAPVISSLDQLLMMDLFLEGADVS